MYKYFRTLHTQPKQKKSDENKAKDLKMTEKKKISHEATSVEDKDFRLGFMTDSKKLPLLF